jgi:hypothetical protein
MGVMNLLKANWTGKVGETVGAKWKDKRVIRTYAKPTDRHTPEQVVIRDGFGAINEFVALFAPQIQTLTALNTRGMTARNAIISINKGNWLGGTFDPKSLLISKGGLPLVDATAATPTGTPLAIPITWAAKASPLISAKAKVIAVWVNAAATNAVAGEALYSALTLSLPAPGAAAGDNLYVYMLDYRGSTRVGSRSQVVAIP